MQDLAARRAFPFFSFLLAALAASAPAAWAQGACCTASSCLPAASEPACATQGGVFLSGESCATSPCGVGACCFDLSCNTANAFDCITAGREFAGAGTTCLQDPCDAGVGACCLGGGNCGDLSPEACGNADGVWLGAGTSCEGHLCDQGACCSPGICEETALYECNASGGLFQNGQDCVTDNCAVPNDCALNSLFPQSPDGPEAFTAYSSELAANLQRWENYSGAAGSLESLKWWGLEMILDDGFTPCDETNPMFEISFHEDVAGLPGPITCSYTLTASVTETGISYQGTELHEYSVVLPTPCVEPEGWVSVVGLGSSSCWFLWISSPDGDGFSYCQNCQSAVEDDDLAICIGGSYGNLFGACCDQSTAGCLDDVEIPSCVGTGLRFEQDTLCAELDPPCTQVTGGCCFENGACSDQLPSACESAGGSWLGAGASCDLCPDKGACCFDQTSCTYETAPVCDALGSTWLGEGTSCDDCSPPPECPEDSLFGHSPYPPSDFLAGTSEESSDLRRAEEFSAVSGAVESLLWWGLDMDSLDNNNWLECVEPDPTFRITFHEDAGGAPGAEVCSYVLTSSYTPTGLQYLGTELNEYGVTLPTPCAVVNGWISIVGLGDPECWFLWMGAGNGTSWCDNCHPSVQDFDLSVCFAGSPGGVFGACCDDTTSSCEDAVEITSCLGPIERFARNQLCADLDPPCGTILGACCMPNATCSSETETDCAVAGGNWIGANKLCDQCPCLTPCPAGGQPQGEPACGPDYDDTFDGGCFASTQVFRPIELNETVCGESGVFLVGGTETEGDYDWYEVDVSVNTWLTWTVEAEFPPRAWIIDAADGCSGAPILDDGAQFECTDLTLTAPVDPGTYWLVVGPATFTDSASCPSSYTAELRNTPLPLTLTLDRDALHWTGAGPRYDVVRGDLGTLRSSGGNFTAATVQCMVNDTPGTLLHYSGVPAAAGQGYWFLVRAVAPGAPGSYDSGGPGQVGTRDVEIAAAPVHCP